jgi:hypothetical protein
MATAAAWGSSGDGAIARALAGVEELKLLLSQGALHCKASVDSKNMTATPDYYADARTIAEMLRRDGLLAEAAALLNALAAGATATEILMRMRWELQKLRQAHRVDNALLERRVDELLQALNAVLS